MPRSPPRQAIKPSFAGFRTRGIDHDDAVRLLRRSVELAKAARDQVPGQHRPRWVAASAGPYGAALADGSEYRGRYGRSIRELTAFHRPWLEVLAGAEPDVIALETVPDADEGAALSTAVAGLGIPAWLSYTISGDPRRRLAPAATPLGRPVPVLPRSGPPVERRRRPDHRRMLPGKPADIAALSPALTAAT